MPSPAATAPLVAARLARLVVRGGEAAADLPPVEERGWVQGLEEAEALLGELAGPPERGSGLDGALPWVERGNAVVACGLPLAAGPEEAQGPDGAYRRSGPAVLREAGGWERPVLSLSDPPVGARFGFDLLWFGPSERYLVRGSRVEIEDLFATVTAPVDRAWLERELVRRRRLDPAVLAGIGPAGEAFPWRVEVRRPVELTGTGWDDPARLLACRESIHGVRTAGDELLLRTDGGELPCTVREGAGGWEAVFHGGDLPWRRLWCRREDDRVVYGAEPVADPRDPGVRTRWAFDLVSDLLKLGEGCRTPTPAAQG